MTDNELIQTLQCCNTDGHPNCNTCPLNEHPACSNIMKSSAINRLKTLMFENAELWWQLHKEIYKREEVESENERLKAGKDTNVPTKWVSVKERLPKKYGRYLILLENGDIFDAEFEVDCNNTFGLWRAEYDPDKFGFLGSEWDEIKSVTHWMPLPEPPSTTEEWHNVCLHAEKGIVCPKPTDFCSYGERKEG